jgi:antirestriction protein ArdC
VTVYDIITERILAKLEQGIIPWKQPWASVGMPRNYVTKKEYRGINAFLLNMAGWSSPFWATYKQVKDAKGQVTKGVMATPIVYFTTIDKTDAETTDTDGKKKKAMVLRYYSVFNLEQTTLVDTTEISKPANPIENCEEVIDHMPLCPKIYHGGSKAFYSTQGDYVKLPAPKQFESAEGYYEVLWHEVTHATGHRSRLNRPGITEHNGFRTVEYGFEELLAEFGAAFLCGHTGIDRTTADSSAGYIQSWMQTIRADNKLVIRAASAAQKAVDFILNVRKNDNENF